MVTRVQGRVRGHKEDRQRAVISLQSFFVCSDIVFTNTAAVTLYHSRLVTLTHFPLPQGLRNVKNLGGGGGGEKPKEQA